MYYATEVDHSWWLKCLADQCSELILSVLASVCIMNYEFSQPIKIVCINDTLFDVRVHLPN